MDMIELLGNATRLRILCALARRGPSTKYRIWKETGVGRRTAIRQLDVLLESGLVRRLSYETVRMYDLDGDSPIVSELRPILEWLWSKTPSTVGLQAQTRARGLK